VTAGNHRRAVEYRGYRLTPVSWPPQVQVNITRLRGDAELPAPAVKCPTEEEAIAAAKAMIDAALLNHR